jgi:hypothetical protein
MTQSNDTIWCDGCGVEILWAPLVVDERYYCCEACLEGVPCACGERMEMADERRAPAGTPAGAETGVPAR